jgi:hypothetical protein
MGWGSQSVVRAPTTRPAPEAATPEGGALPGAGTRIGAYEIIRELGRGGMGAVYLARDTKLGRRVAIKFLQNDEPDLTARFILEARATARCNHENIVVIHEVAEHDGYPFMVLEYLQGTPLSRLLDRPLPPQRAVELIVPVVRALACAHEHNIIHRDLKPDNIFLTDAGTVKVLDFGIAKLGQGALADELSEMWAAGHAGAGSDGIDLAGWSQGTLTRRGALLGTLSYMSPEQWGAAPVDARSDIWAVGIILYRLVAGKHPLAPLQGRQLVVTGQLSVPMPGVRDARPDLPGALADVIDRCLRKHKDERMGSARELLAALEPLLSGSHAHAHAPHAYDSPYPGLGVFQEADAARFFGRGRDVAAALARLREQPLLGVVGPSGVGKSSFVRAGLLPALQRSGEPWTSIIVRPGRHALAALAQTVAPLVRAGAPAPVQGSSASAVVAGLTGRLRDEPGYLGSILRDAAEQRGQRVVLFIDQLEELYTLAADAGERRAFTACLASAADDVAAPVRVVLTIRSDFLDRVAEDSYFMAELAHSLFFLPAPSRAGLREALVEPAERAGYRFESPSMVEHILDHLAETQGALPLLQFAASKLWDLRDRDRRLLGEDGYRSIGGIAGALASHADAIIAALAPPDQALARSVLLALVTPERTRAVVTLPELGELVRAPGEVQRLVTHLAQARLLVIQTGDAAAASSAAGPASGATGEHGGAMVEIVHESLIHAWPRLRRWLDEHQDDAAFLDELRSAARQWQAHGRTAGLLWRGEAVEEARRWRQRYGRELPELQRQYLAAVFALADRARRRRRLLLGGIFGLMTMLIAAAVVALLIIRGAQRSAADQAALAMRAERELRAQNLELRRQERELAMTAGKERQATLRANTAMAELGYSHAELQRQAAALVESLRMARQARLQAIVSEKEARNNETAARQAEEEAHLTIQRLQEQIAAMSTRIVDLEALIETMIDDVQVEPAGE